MLEMKLDERLLHTRYDGTQVLVVHASIKHWMFTFCRLTFLSDHLWCMTQYAPVTNYRFWAKCLFKASMP